MKILMTNDDKVSAEIKGSGVSSERFLPPFCRRFLQQIGGFLPSIRNFKKDPLRVAHNEKGSNYSISMSELFVLQVYSFFLRLNVICLFCLQQG